MSDTGRSNQDGHTSRLRRGLRQVLGRHQRDRAGDIAPRPRSISVPVPVDSDVDRAEDEAAPSEQLFAPDDHDLAIRLLGSTEVWSRGTRVEQWASLRGLAILRFLALNCDRPVHREKLMDLLWPEASARAARNNLNVAMYGLRRSLEVGGSGPYIIFRAGCYLFEPSLDIWVDVEAFGSLRDEAHELRRSGQPQAAQRVLRRAIELYRGELFEDDAEGEWYLPLRDRLAEQLAEALDISAEQAFAEGDLIACVDRCHEVLQVDPCREFAHRLLMHAYVARDQHHLAARQYACCVSNLREHLGVAPQPETTSTFVELLGRYEMPKPARAAGRRD